MIFGCPTVAAAGATSLPRPGSMVATFRSVGRWPLGDVTRTATPSADPTHSGSVPARPTSGPASASASRSVSSVWNAPHVPFLRSATFTSKSSPPRAQVTPTIENGRTVVRGRVATSSVPSFSGPAFSCAVFSGAGGTACWRTSLRSGAEGLGDGVAAGAAEAAGTSGACVAGTSSSCSVAGRGAAACDVWVGAVSGVAMRADTATAVTTANGKARRTRVQKRMWGSPIL